MPVPVWDSDSMRWGSLYRDGWKEQDVRGEPFRVHWSEFEGGSYSSVVSARMSQNQTLRFKDYYTINKVLAIQKDLGTAVDISVVGGDGQSNVVTLGSALSNTDLLLVLQGVRQ